MDNPIPRNRRGGPRPRLSREIFISTALELLNEGGIEQFSITKLGKRLNATAMSIYTYFPSRDALLEAAADHVFALFTPPPEVDCWQEYMLAWVNAIIRHFERFPAALEVLAWDEHVSASWLRAWIPAARVLRRKQPDLDRLAVITDWFLVTTIGFIYAHLRGTKRLAAYPEGVLDGFDEEDRELLIGLQQRHLHPDESQRLRIGFRNIVSGLEALLSEDPVTNKSSKVSGRCLD